MEKRAGKKETGRRKGSRFAVTWSPDFAAFQLRPPGRSLVASSSGRPRRLISNLKAAPRSREMQSPVAAKALALLVGPSAAVLICRGDGGDASTACESRSFVLAPSGITQALSVHRSLEVRRSSLLGKPLGSFKICIEFRIFRFKAALELP